MKQLVKKILGRKIMSFYFTERMTQALRHCYKIDCNLYIKHSSAFSVDTLEKKEALITFRSHSIEKGFLHNPIRYRFAQQKIEELIRYLNEIDVVENIKRTQMQAAIANLCNYFEFHKAHEQDISDFFTNEEYFRLKEHLIITYPCTILENKNAFFEKNDHDFFQFSESRHSVRSFNGEKIPETKLKRVIKLANNAPSVCNRQGVSVFVIENKDLIDQIVELQGGLKGFSENLNQLIVLTANRNYFYSIGERNQLFIDGGIYLMNLLYALHYYKIAACTAHWSMPVEADEKMKQMLELPESLKIICLVAIGIPEESFSVTSSLKRTGTENLHIIV